MSELDNILRELNKNTKVITEGITLGDEGEKIPFSSPRANYMLYGGIPMYRIIEFAGLESSGKTTSALDIIANYQKMEGSKKVIYIDHEGTLDKVWARKLGVNVDEIVHWKPEEQSAEKIFDFIIRMVKTDEVGFVVIDSLAALIPEQIFDESFDKQEMGGIAKALTRFCRAIIPLLRKHKTTLIGINQLRDDMDSMWNEFKTPGGRGWKFFCSLRLMFKQGKFFDENLQPLTMNAENPYGNRVDIKIVKSKVCNPDRKNGFYSLTYRNGIAGMGDTLDCAIEFGLIQRRGAWYNLIDWENGEVLSEPRFQGLQKVYDYFRENEEEYKKLWDEVNRRLCEGNDE